MITLQRKDIYIYIFYEVIILWNIEQSRVTFNRFINLKNYL